MSSELKLTLLGAFLALLGLFHHYDKQVAVEEATHKLENQYRDALQQAATAALKTQEKLQLTSTEAIKEKDAKISNLSSRVVALNQLLNTTKRPTDNPTAPETGGTCTGAQLYREDGEFLAGEAARAEKVMIERNYYYTEYENARRILSEQGK